MSEGRSSSSGVRGPAGAVEEVARLVWEAGAAVGPLLGNGDAVGVLGRWLDGADAGRAEDALLASYHLREIGRAHV